MYSLSPPVYIAIVLLIGCAVFWTFRYLSHPNPHDKQLAQVSSVISFVLVVGCLYAGVCQMRSKEREQAAPLFTAAHSRNLRQIGSYVSLHFPEARILLLADAKAVPSQASVALLEAALKQSLSPGITVHTELISGWMVGPQLSNACDAAPESATLSQLNSILDQLVATHTVDVIVDTTTLLSSCRIGASGTWQLPQAQRPKLIIANAVNQVQLRQMISDGWVTASIWDPQTANGSNGSGGSWTVAHVQMIDASNLNLLPTDTYGP